MYDQERKAKQDREEVEREKFRSNIREKYGIAKKDNLHENKFIKVRLYTIIKIKCIRKNYEDV